MSIDTFVLSMQSAVDMVSGTPSSYRLSLANIFLLFFVMLGPIKIFGPFFASAAGLSPAEHRLVAWKVFGYSVIAVLVAGIVGSSMMMKWHIEPAIMLLAGGLVFLLAALQMVLAQYRAPKAAAPVPAPESAPTPKLIHHLICPVTVPPYGVAAVIVLMALSQSGVRSVIVLGLALVVLVIDLLAMLVVRWVMRGIGPVILQVLGAVLGILQVGLGLQFMAAAWRQLALP